ncbi:MULTISPECIES: hypothetical protein [unclassified Novosphingobium]|uniref:hypothetical protein n=1 Tax=unclassified Novosphingobium TaxID=2644732 RepID=UPI001359DD51|nr:MULTISPECIES: hypothetical protein [unclassified Novosphingobium]
MIRNLLTAVAVAGILAASPTLAAPCKDAKGKFIKCANMPAAMKPGVVKGKDGKCRLSAGPKKGQFTKC